MSALSKLNADERDVIYGEVLDAFPHLWGEGTDAELHERAERHAAFRLYAADGPRWTGGS